MAVHSGAQFAQLLTAAFDAMVEEVMVDLTNAGHPGLTVANERAMRAVDDGADSAADLARVIGVSRQAAAKTIDALEGLGYVTREPDVTDARRKSLTVTPRGRDAVATGAAAFDRIFRRWRRATGPASEDVVSALERLAGSA